MRLSRRTKLRKYPPPVRILVAMLVGLCIVLGWGQIHASGQSPVVNHAEVRGTVVSEPLLSTGLALPTAIARSPSATLHLQAGLDFFAAGQYAQAIQTWQQALVQGSTRPLVQALTYNYLATAYQELGQWDQAQQTITTSRALLERSRVPSRVHSPIQARLLTTAARLDLAQGHLPMALHALQEAERLYGQVNDPEGQLGSQLNQVQVMMAMGRYRPALKRLQIIHEQLNRQPDSLAAVGHLSVGNVYQAIGDLGAAWCELDQGLALAQDQGLMRLQSEFQSSLGNVAMAWSQRDEIQRHPALPRHRVGWRTPHPQRRLRESCASPEGLVGRGSAPLLVQDAQRYYRQAAQQSVSPSARLTARLQLLEAQLYDLHNRSHAQAAEVHQSWQRAGEQWQQLRAELLAKKQRGSLSRDRVLLLLKLAQQGAVLHEHIESVTPTQIREGLESAIALATQLQDPVAQSMAYGTLGHFDEMQGRWSSAQAATQQALQQAGSDPSQVYQWHWQLGRIDKARGDRQAALRNYAAAIDTLQHLRPTLNVIGSTVTLGEQLSRLNTDFQYYFRDRVEPVYREYIDLLLTTANPHNIDAANIGSAEPEPPLFMALAAYELLQESELETLLRCNLRARETTDSPLPVRDLQTTATQVQQKLDQIHQHSPQTAVLFPIELRDRVVIVLSLPQQPLIWATHSVAPEAMAQTLWNLKQALTPHYSQQLETYQLRDLTYIIEQAQQVYDWVLGPVQASLHAQPIDQIITMPDSLLRDIPLAVLYDRDNKAFLTESYGTAIVPSLLQAPLNPAPTSPRILATGLTTLLHPSQRYMPLSTAQQEVTQVSQRFRRRSRLTGKQFTWANVEHVLAGQQFTNVHIATHGEFSAQPQGTFLIDAQLQPLTLERLEAFLHTQTSLSLLALSACQSAQGSYRATLGLAGIAIQSGAQNTLATLFIVPDDIAAATMQQFYALLQADRNPVTALQQIQKNEIQAGIHPSYWSPYVMVGLGR